MMILVRARMGGGVAFVAALVVVTSGAAQPLHAPCPRDMLEIDGEYCPELEHVCLSLLPREKGEPPRCAEYAKTSTCRGRPKKKHFCIDRFEFPNEQGKKPTVMKSWQDARDACRHRGKRLCGDSEWTLACEGPMRSPYPYGTKRDDTACNIDKVHVDVDPAAILSRAKRGGEVARLWQGEESGAREGCVSAYGVFDMTGNVDEWVVNESGTPFESGLKGGYWGRVRNACRPMTTAHGETFPFYQTGFRCCANATTER
jgi:formylglycine-generating enzyme